MTGIRTYIFGNPSGWVLYEGDAKENDYYKSFYVGSRHGSRLMVNRRDDNTVVYTYVNYDMFDGSDRHGNSHFGMSVVVEDGNYSPEFRLIFRFMESLFQRVMELERPLYKIDDFGKIRYNVRKLSDASECVEWIKSRLDLFFRQKLQLRKMSGDASFSEGAAGRVATLAPDENDAAILDAFRKSNWVAISENFRRKNKDIDHQVAVEINLFDIYRQNSVLSQQLLDSTTGVSPLSRKRLDIILGQVNDTRVTLANYINTMPEDEKVARDLSEQYTKLRDSVERMIAKYDNATDSDGEDENENNIIDKERKKDDKEHEECDKQDVKNDIMSLLHANFPKVIAGLAVVVVVAICLWLVPKCGHQKDSGGDIDNTKTDQSKENEPVDVLDLATFEQMLTYLRFVDAYDMIFGKEYESQYISQIKDSLNNYLWCLAEQNNGGIQILKFFADTDNANLLRTIFKDKSLNDVGKYYQEASTKYNNTQNILSKELLSKADMVEIRQNLKDYDRWSGILIDAEKRFLAQSQTQQGKTDKDIPLKESETGVLTLTMTVDGKETKFEFNKNKTKFGSDVMAGKNINIKLSKGKITYPDSSPSAEFRKTTAGDRLTITKTKKGKIVIGVINTDYQFTITIK